MKDLADYWVEVKRSRTEADQVHRKFLANLFSGDHKAMTVLKLKDIAGSSRRRPTPSRTSRTRSRASPSRSLSGWTTSA